MQVGAVRFFVSVQESFGNICMLFWVLVLLWLSATNLPRSSDHLWGAEAKDGSPSRAQTGFMWTALDARENFHTNGTSCAECNHDLQAPVGTSEIRTAVVSWNCSQKEPFSSVKDLETI